MDLDIELHPNDWDDIYAKISSMSMYIDDLKAANTYLEEAESSINQHDVDHLISFSHTSKASKLEGLRSDLSTLQDYANREPDYVVDNYDKPFYDKIDAYVDGMQDLDINSYEVNNNLGIKQNNTYYDSATGQSTTYKTTKDKINLDDIMKGNNALSSEMKEEWKYYKEHGGKKISYSDFTEGMLNQAGFKYKSQKDSQFKLETIITTVLVVGSFVTGPVGIACMAILITSDVVTLATGKNVFTGRKVDDSEKWMIAAGLVTMGVGKAYKVFRGGKVIEEEDIVVDSYKN